LWRAYQAEGELGLRHQMERGIMDWLRLAGEEDTGVHGSYRLRSTLNTVGVSGCIGTSHEETTMSTADGYLHREMDSHGVRAKADVLGVQVAELRAGYIHSKEKESRQVSFHGKEAHMHRDTSFEGLGTDVRIGSGQAPGARLQSGLGRFQESISCASKDGTESFHSQQMVIGGHTKASLAGKTMDLRAGYIHS
ncbi:J domain-containing protein, partial [Durusdinium trenchii]